MSRDLIQFSNLSKSFQSVSIFENISFSINEGECFALIGENGSGKTTLLKLLMESVEPDCGKVSHAANLTVGYLPQEVTIEAESVKGYFEEDRLSQLEQQMAVCLEDSSRLDEWEQLHETYVQLGGYRRVPVEKVLEGLKIDQGLLSSPVSVLSSGQKTRIALARIIIENPEVLLLDEPTNHLDASMVDWLKEVLLERKGATVLVSHDRAFINRVCNHLIAINGKSLRSYGGNYDFYLDEKERQIQREIKSFEALKEKKGELKQKIKAISFSKKKPRPPKDRNVMAYDRRGEHHQKSVQRNLEGLKAQLEEVEGKLMENPKPKSNTGIRFFPNPLAHQVAIELYQIEKSFGDKVLFTQLSQTIAKNDRVIITGPNGSGKTTLLRCLAGLEKVDGGEIRFCSKAKVGYLDQEGERVSLELSPLQYFSKHYQLSEEELRRQLHMAALGSGELLSRPFSSLSVGQRKRLMILGLILDRPNILLLDEPTNHLDFATLEALESALQTFEGVVIAVSHDAVFMEKLGKDQCLSLIL